MISRFVKPEQGIDTIASLRLHLQLALEVEHSVIPPYLCALYSIQDGTNVEAAAAVKEVVLEEMLHMTLAANVLNAIGGQPDLKHPKFVPSYPCYLPHGNNTIVLNLAPFSREAVASFMTIEHPCTKDAPPQAHHYATIGQFYAAIIDAIKHLAKRHPKMFSGARSKQVSGKYYYNSGGEVVEVSDLESAIAALEIIVIEGEGRDDSIYNRASLQLRADLKTLAHYFVFNQIYEGCYYTKGDTPKTGPTGGPFPVDWNAGIYPMRENPTIRNYAPGSDLWNLTNDFNIAYRKLLASLHDSFNGVPEKLVEGVAIMMRLKGLAQGLMLVPCGHFATTAGPSFECVLSKDPAKVLGDE